MKQRLAVYLFSLIVLLPLVYVFGTGIMEARTLISAQSMALDNNWLIPHLYTEIRLNKPPLPVWLTAPIFLVNPHPSMLALHIPVILVTSLLGVFCCDIALSLGEKEKTGLYAGLVISTMLLTLKLGTTNSWDIYSVVFMTGALAALLRREKHWLVIGTACMAASVLSKGPVQLYTMLLPFLAAMLLFRRPLPWKRLALITGTGCAIGSLWYLYVYLAVPQQAAAVARGEVSAWSSLHTASFFFYLSFPAFAGAWALPSLCALLEKWLPTTSGSSKKFLLCWFFLSLLLISLVPEKKERYLMPTMVPLALLTAQVLYHWVKGLQNGMLSRMERRIISVHLIGGTIAAVGICLFIAWNNRDHVLYLSLFTLLCAGIGLVGIKKPGLLVPVTCMLVLLTSLAGFRAGSTRPIIQKIPPTCSLEELRTLPRIASLPCYSFDNFNPTDEWEIGRDTTRISSLSDIKQKTFLLLDTDTTPPAALSENGVRVMERFLVQTSRNSYMQLFVVEKAPVSSGE